MDDMLSSWVVSFEIHSFDYQRNKSNMGLKVTPRLSLNVVPNKKGSEKISKPFC